jgi:superfamily I DNA and/or RNA helicase
MKQLLFFLQGSECDILIISCVRSYTGNNSIGFVGDEQRLNVALTRAKFALYIVGNFDVLKVSLLNYMGRVKGLCYSILNSKTKTINYTKY